MSTQNLRCVQKRESRARQTARYHHLAFIAEYVRIKYNENYKEADNFYWQLYQAYPHKRKLTTCHEFKAWEIQTKKHKDSTTTTQTSPAEDHPEDHPEEKTTPTDNLQINVPLMSPVEVQATKDMVMFEAINPSLTEEISDDLINEIIRDIQENDAYGIFSNNNEYDEDLNDEINDEINASLNELSAIEKELLRY